MKVVNLTPHPINFITDVGTLVIPTSGTVARVSEEKKVIGTVEADGFIVPVNRKKYGDVEGLPDPEEGTIYVVSLKVAEAVPDRPDVYIVDDTVRDSEGHIVGARALAHV